jgi:hypothetical protein
MRPGSLAWWANKIRQTRNHLFARVTDLERHTVAGWLTPAQLDLFAGMHVADQRHGLDVVDALRMGGTRDPEVLLAGLLHDAGKGDAGLLPRVIHSLGEAGFGWVGRVAGILPPMRRVLERLRDHAETSALIAAAAGCSPRTVDLIRWQDDPRDPDAGERLRLADEAS